MGSRALNREKLIREIENDIREEEKIRETFAFEKNDARRQFRKGFVRRLQLERREAGLDGVVLKAQEVASLQENEGKQEERLAEEMALIRLQEIKDEKLRQQLRENSHELKELEKQLKAAYTNKVLAAQIAENRAQKEHEQMMEQRGREMLVSALGNLEEMENRVLIHEKKQKDEYRKTLQDQIIEKERLKREEFVAFMRERKLFEDTIKRIKDDEEKEMAEKIMTKQLFKEEMEQFIMAREIWKAKERKRIDKENERLEAEMRLNEKQQVERNAQKRVRNIEENQKIISQMTQQVVMDRKKKEEFRELVDLLRENERIERESKRAEEEQAKEQRIKNEARVEIQMVLAEKARKMREEKEYERKITEQMNLKMAEERRKEKEMMENKRLLRIKDRKYNEELMKQTVQKRAEDLKLCQMAVELEEREEKKRMEMIEAERIRILREHAPNLLGYFPKGCLSERDLELLGITGNSPLPEATSQLINK